MSGWVPKERTAFRLLMQKFPRRLRPAAWAFWDEALMRANYESSWVNGEYLERGQFLFGRAELGEQLGLSEGQIRTTSRWMKNLQEMTIETTNRGSKATILKFNTYVPPLSPNDQPSDQQTTSKYPKSDHSEQLNNITREKYYPSGSPPNPVKNPKAYIAYCMDAFLNETPHASNTPLPRAAWSWIGRAEKEGPGRLCQLAAACRQQHRKGWTVNDLPNTPKQGRQLQAIIGYLNTVADQMPEKPQESQTPLRVYHITHADGSPVTDHQQRLKRILAAGYRNDPDQGYDWTISNRTISASKNQ